MDNGMSDSPENLNLPKPQARPAAAEQAPQAAPTPEQGMAATPETAPTPAVKPAQPVQIPSQPPVAQQQTPQQATPKIADDDLSAEDVDNIGKEWVAKAKKIVDQTKDDPHLQNKQISRVKADYIKKRYNKDIRVSDT